MTEKKRPVGVIEGFYGRSWSWSARNEYAQFMADENLSVYIYAPKSDVKLRHAWVELWTDEELSALQLLAQAFKAKGLTFGLGLSPIGLADLNTGSQAAAKSYRQLDEKLAQIQSISADFLCILFDDMISLGDDMARQQLRIVDHIVGKAVADRYIVCPSYYSTDPILEKLFGPRPEGYWRDLGQSLPAEIGYFWTGEQVCSQDFSDDNLHFIADQLARLPVIWDNYPVNDGAKLSRFLHLQPFKGRSSLIDMSAGHFANPMNQPYLSQLPLASLARLYPWLGAADKGTVSYADEKTAELLWQEDAERLFGSALGSSVLKDAPIFSTQGLDELSAMKKQTFINHYAGFNSVYADELVDWLTEQYVFDPACLTG
ncbi:MAG: beta-N-acetylglucosaminidase domain-containing protein [Pseudomonadales bacterium]|nr:beta-N-acetylglucosaminidase domain-containing protein [Pseudomonadales bacterium]